MFKRMWLAIVVGFCLVPLVAGTALAAVPPETSDATWMVNAPVRAIKSAGGKIWIGGKFDHLLTPTGAAGPAAVALTAFNPSTGAPDPANGPSLGGTAPIVMDLEIGPDGLLYVAGTFTYTFGGAAKRNLMAINPSTGKIVRAFSTPKLYTAYPTSSRVYVGGVNQLTAYQLSGGLDPGFHKLVPKVDDSLRDKPTADLFRDIVMADGDVVGIGQFDSVNGVPAKVAVKANAVTGAIQSWKLANLNPDGGAFGIQGLVVGSNLIIAAGGSDYAASYASATGSQRWKTDTSGSAQSVDLYGGDTLIFGGHFQYVAAHNGQTCGNSHNPNTACLHLVRIAAMDLDTGDADANWMPQICCMYRGVWAVEAVGAKLHIGGEFKRAGGRLQQYYARF